MMERKLVALNNSQQAELRTWDNGVKTLCLREDARIEDGVLVEAQCIHICSKELAVLLALLASK